MKILPWLALGLFLSDPAIAANEPAFEFWPGAEYDPAIPTIEQVVGHVPGEQVTSSGDVIRYFERLAAAAPDRLRVTRYGKTWQGRDLIYVTLTSPANMARLAQLQAGLRELAEPRGQSAARASELTDSLPATSWLSYGVHGNELSSTEAAMLTAYHLLAATNDERSQRILADSIVYLDPNQNPDGRQRFIHHFENTLGLQPDDSPVAAERVEPWPGGRGNHYLFDLNRDWYALTQPETQGRVAVLRELMPLVFVDAHEMSGDSTYYFAPEAVPYNPHLVKAQRDNLELFGRNNARWFDRFGIDYFTRETFDAFFPGYGASWPSYYGSVAMTYEQARVRGLVYRRYDDKLLHFRESVRNHFVSSLSTAEVTAANKRRFLQDFHRYRASAVEEGRREKVKTYLVPTQRDQSAADKLAGLLAMQGVEVGRVESPLRACGRDYAAGSYVISAAQPSKRLLRVLLERHVAMPDDFLAEQERRRSKNIGHEIYDVTAWSLPLMFNVQVDECGAAVAGGFVPVAGEFIRLGRVQDPGATVSFLVPWGSAGAARLLSQSLQAGLEIKTTEKGFKHAGRVYPSGTLIIDVADNPADLASRLDSMAAATGAEVIGVSDSWVAEGPNFGSERVMSLLRPRVALAWDQPTSSLSAGHTRFVIERQFGYPVTPVRTRSLAGADLRRFDVIILPDLYQSEGYQTYLGEDGVANLRRWVEEGGTLVALGDALKFLADPQLELSALRVEDAYVAEAEGNGEADQAETDQAETDKAEADKEPEATVPGTLIDSEEAYREALRPEREEPDSVPGALVRAVSDPDHWLAAGVADTVHVIVSGSLIVAPLPLDEGANVLRFEAADRLVAGGHLWEENRLQLAYKPFVTAESRGRGLVIGFTQDPVFRAQMDGLNVVFMNAVLLAPSRARKPGDY